MTCAHVWKIKSQKVVGNGLVISEVKKCELCRVTWRMHCTAEFAHDRARMDACGP